MDYKYTGKYKGFPAEPECMAIYVKEGDEVFEYKKIQLGTHYEIVGSSLIIGAIEIQLKKDFNDLFLTENFIFIQSGGKLEIFDLQGNLYRKFKSNCITRGEDCFLILDNPPYVVDKAANTIFVIRASKIVGFNSSGDIFYICSQIQPEIEKLSSPKVNEFSGSNENTEKKSSNLTVVKNLSEQNIQKKFKNSVILNKNLISRTKAQDCFITIDDLRSTFDGWLVIENLKNKKEFKTETVPIYQINDICVYQQNARIENVVDVVSCSIIPSNPLAHLILTVDAIFLIYENYIIKQSLKRKYFKICCKKSVLIGCGYEDSFANLFYMLSVFITFKYNCTENIDVFLCSLVMHKIDIKNFVKCLEFNEKQMIIPSTSAIICRAYRIADDPGKKILNEYIETMKLSVDELYYIIIYKPEFLERFVKECKYEKKLFLIDELKEFYFKTNRIDEFKRILLKNDILLFEYSELNTLNTYERLEVESQRKTSEFKQ